MPTRAPPGTTQPRTATLDVPRVVGASSRILAHRFVGCACRNPSRPACVPSALGDVAAADDDPVEDRCADGQAEFVRVRAVEHDEVAALADVEGAAGRLPSEAV